MKFAGKILFLAGALCFLMTYSSCKKKHDEVPPITDQQLDLLTKGNSVAWNLTAVTRDGIDQKSDYPAFVLTLTGSHGQTKFGYSTSGRPALSSWPPSGNFTFDATSPTTKLSRDDNPDISVTYSATATQLIMSYPYSGSGYTARVGNVNGNWVFTFAP
jgi:hypothetical protein